MVADPGVAFATSLLFLCTLVPLVLWISARAGALAPSAFAITSRLIVGFGSLWLFGLEASDASVYDRLAKAVATFDAETPLVSGKEGWPLLLGHLYRWLGYSPEMGLVINAAVAGLVPVVVASTCKAFGWPSATKPAAWLVAVFPACIPWTSYLVRESIVILLLACLPLAAAWLRSGKILPGVLLLIGATLLLIWFRGGLAYIGAMVIPAILMLEVFFNRGIKLAVRMLLPLAAVGLLIVVMPTLSRVAEDASYFDTEQLDRLSVGLSTGTTGTLGNNAGEAAVTEARETANGQGWWRGIRAFPSTTIGPFPWNWRNPQLALAGLDGFLWLGLIVAVVVGTRATKDKFAAMICFVPAGLLFVYLGTAGSNFGLVMRLRALGIPILAPIAGLGLAVIWSRWLKRASLGSGDQPTIADGTSTPPPVEVTSGNRRPVVAQRGRTL